MVDVPITLTGTAPLTLTGSVTVTLSGTVSVDLSTEPNPPPVETSQQRGIAIPTWDVDGYPTGPTTDALDRMKMLGANWVSFVPSWYQDGMNADSVHRTQQTVGDAQLTTAVGLAHSRGFKVQIKPHIDITGGGYRGNITPSDRAAWFQSYQSMIVDYAALAEQVGAEQFSIGCELRSMTRTAPASWLDLIAAVRGAYQGEVTYSANWDEYQAVAFWDSLDLIGIDGYWPVATDATTDVATLKNGFARVRDQLRAFSSTTGKRILFTEHGFASSTGTATAPWEDDRGAVAYGEQAAATQASLETFADETWWAGVMWWIWWSNPGQFSQTDHSIGGKPVEDVLHTHWRNP